MLAHILPPICPNPMKPIEFLLSCKTDEDNARKAPALRTTPLVDLSKVIEVCILLIKCKWEPRSISHATRMVLFSSLLSSVDRFILVFCTMVLYKLHPIWIEVFEVSNNLIQKLILQYIRTKHFHSRMNIFANIKDRKMSEKINHTLVLASSLFL